MASANDPIVTSGAASTSPSYLEWGPVWAGSVVALAASGILLQFGAGVGLSLGDASLADGSASYNFIVAGLWVLLVSVGSSSAAGYISGRMRMTANDATADEVEFRDGVHGITAWALATFISAALVALFTAITAAIGTASETQAVELTEQAQTWAANQAVIFSFSTAAGAVLGAAAAWFASVAGGNHRDSGTSHNVIVPKMFARK